MRRGPRFALYGFLLLLSATGLRAQTTDLLINLEPFGALAGLDNTFTVTVANFGIPAQNAVVTDVLPDHTTFVSAQAPSGWTCGLGTSAGKPAVLCTIASMPVTDPFGPRPTIAIVLRIAPDFPFNPSSLLSNTVTISSDTPESNTANNSSTYATNVEYFSDLAIDSSASPAAIPVGSTVPIALDLENRGPAEGWYTTFQDTLPPFLSFVSLDAPGWTCTTPAVGSSGQISCQRDRFAPGSYAARIFVRADQAGEGENVAAIGNGSADLTPDDRATRLRLVAAAAAQVPALSPAGLAALAAGLLAAGFALLRRRAG